MDSLKLELLKNKQEHARSAIASQEVREHLAGFIRSKRQGSSGQINSIQVGGGHQQLVGKSGWNGDGGRSGRANARGGRGGGGGGNGGGANNNYSSHYVANLINEGQQDEDHPLRKTASLPTMHIPYKAQSLSRRRQMERRTTMSPLMRQKSKPKRQLLHSHDSSSTEYSSNPCIIQQQPSRTCARSLSQSSSPPPPQQPPSSTVKMDTCNDEDGGQGDDDNLGLAQQQQLPSSQVTTNNMLAYSATAPAATANPPNSQPQVSDPMPSSSSSASSQAIKLSSIFTNSELENLQNNLKNSKSHSSTTNIHQAVSQQQKININQEQPASISGAMDVGQPLPLDQQHALMRQQQHLKVNESIRRTVIQRASSRGRQVAGGGSLDIEGTLAGSGVNNETEGSKNGPGHQSESFGEELRQWSLDGADLRASAALSKLAAGSSMGGAGLFHRDFHKLRLATTKDAATLRRSQSPSSSISMGLSSGQAAASIAQLQQQQQHQQQQAGIHNSTMPYSRTLSSGQHIHTNVRHHSSSSSSTSSLLSQQDSLEDSSSQAIDLSSSSEVSRRHNQHHHHHHHHQQQHPQSTSIFTSSVNHAHNTRSQQLTSQLIKTTNSNILSTNTTPKQAAAAAAAATMATNQQHQKKLQNSFNQLQLCQSQEGLNQFHFLPATTKHQQQQQQSVPSQHHQAVQRGDSSNATCQHHHHPPPFLDISKMASSLDAASSHQHPMGSLSEQFNLSASAQNLITLQDHHFHYNYHQQQQHQQHVHLLQQQLQHQSHNSPIAQNPQQVATTTTTTTATNQMAGQQQDLNQLMLTYKNLIHQSPEVASSQSQQKQETGQLSGQLLAKINNLPEAYRSNLISHLIQQQQQQQQLRTFNTVTEDQGKRISPSQVHHGYGPSCHYHHQCQQQPHAEHLDHHRSLISRALSSPLLAPRPTLGLGQDHKASLPTDTLQDRMVSCDIVMGNLNDRLDASPTTQLLQATSSRLMQNLRGEFVAPGGVRDQEARGNLLGAQDELAAGESGRNSTSVMIIDNVDDRNLQEKTPKSKQFNITENSSHSLDLTTTSSRSVSVASGAGCFGGGGGGGCEGGSGNKADQATLLNFNYTPRDPMKVSCSFIYNPIFDKSSRTGLIYELGMCNHKCICGDENNHPENSHRILAIWRRLYDVGLMAKCARIEGRRASLEEIQLCHSETYSYYFGKGPYERLKISQLDLSKLPIEGLTQLECGGQGADIDTPWNEEQTPGVARLAAGCVIEAAVSVANGKFMNAFAIVRPPGHHAELQQAMGFCFFNSVAIAARVLISKHKLARVLIVDWDVHHGNGIQKMFYEDKRVMYISLHRHDKGNFFPGTGDTKEIGAGQGEGFNWNIAWSSESMGDAEYLAAFRCLVMPIVMDYNPSLVLVACGFDAARGHPSNFGGYDLSPACFAYMTRQLMSLANGRLVLCLEGGYQLSTICDCAESCVRALLNESNLNQMDQVRESELRREPNQSASQVLFEVSSLAAKYWPNVERWRGSIYRSALEAAEVADRPM